MFSTKSSSLVSIPITPLPPRRCWEYVLTGRRLTYPLLVMVTTTSSCGMRSSRSSSTCEALICVLRSLLYFCLSSESSDLIIPYFFSSLSMIDIYSAISRISSAYSSSTFCLSSPVSFCRRMSRIAFACISSSPKLAIKPDLASSTVLEARMREMTASRWSSAIFRPRSMWARSSAFFNWN